MRIGLSTVVDKIIAENIINDYKKLEMAK